jgi:hypothetical protein
MTRSILGGVEMRQRFPKAFLRNQDIAYEQGLRTVLKFDRGDSPRWNFAVAEA